MSGSVTVTGGINGITANLDDLLGLVRLMQSGADSVEQVLDQLTTPVLQWVLEIGADHDPCGAQQLQVQLAALAGRSGQLPAAQARIQSLSFLLRAAIASYQHADDSVLSSITHALGHLALGSLRIMTGDYLGGDEVFTALPGLTDLAMGSLYWMEAPFSDVVPDGHAVLHDMGPDPRDDATPPKNLADLIGALALRNGGRAGEISVSFVNGADGRRRAIVDVPGTKSWNAAPNHDVTSVGTDIRALAGRRTAYEDGIFEALDAAGVAPDEDVMLVGHSEGGIVAVNAASDAARSGRFRITHVVTAGSPIGRIATRLPGSVQVLALENADDVVPHFDSASNPDRPNITTVTVHDQHYSIADNHDLNQTYAPAAAAADHSCDASIDGFLRSAHGFLEGSTMQTHAYRITRGF